MNIGFTGTRKGMTRKQKAKIKLFFEGHLLDLDMMERDTWVVRHGGCDGSDDDFHNIASEYADMIYVYPGDEQQKTKYKNSRFVTVTEIKPYLERNKDIVHMTGGLLATPKGFKEEKRSGTWMTIRHAKKVKKPVFIIYPDGKLEILK